MSLLLGQDKKTQLIMFTQINPRTHRHTLARWPETVRVSVSVYKCVYLESLWNTNIGVMVRRSRETDSCRKFTNKPGEDFLPAAEKNEGDGSFTV